MKNSIAVVVPSFNARHFISACLDSLLTQSLCPRIIVVENGSTDGSLELLKQRYSREDIELIVHHKNKGFTGGVNTGILRAMELGCEYVGLLNDDAAADKDWLRLLRNELEQHPKAGIATAKILDKNGVCIDSTGEFYTSWGLPFPRGRGEKDTGQYDRRLDIFGASGGASLYRLAMLKEVGLFDNDFFAYYEDIDISFRAQLSGWGVRYVPAATVRHQIGATAKKIKGFTTYQTMKNLPWLFWKNVPFRLAPALFLRFTIAYLGFFVSALGRGHGWYALKGVLVSLLLLPKKAVQRWHIQARAQVTPEFINSIIVHDLPPGATRLRSLRNRYRKSAREAL